MANPELLHRLLEHLGAQKLKVNGSSITCACPLHMGDNERAFAVYWDRGRIAWQCYTQCADKGRLAKLLMRKQRLFFPEAVVALAKFAGMDISGDGGLVVTQEQLDDESLASLQQRLGGAAQTPVIFGEDWVQQAIGYWSHASAPPAWDFLTGPLNTLTDAGEKRKEFPAEVLRNFQVGFVPANHWTLPDPSKPSGNAGWFCDRICIPWRDIEGKCIGFAGRRFDGLNYTKYQTFPHTRKGLTLYGLHDPRVIAAIKASHKIILVEGYGDVWRAWQHGLFNVVSPGGTELSRFQIRLLYTLGVEEVIFYFDSDEAGVKTSRKMSDLIKDTVNVRTGFPPQGLDPGDLLIREQYMAGIDQSTIVF